MGKNRVPKGWLGCPKNGNRLIASKFMALKTPLDSKFRLSSNSFPPEDIFLKAKRNNVKIGLWIDLTNTDRYYSINDIIYQNRIYEKIECSGRGICPSRNEINRFISIVHDFIINKPHECIAVHCTHGFNRTGFMIITFLVEKMRYTIQEAYESFTEARPPGIYRENYLVKLFRSYSKVAPPSIPNLPSWVKEKEMKRFKKKFYN